MHPRTGSPPLFGRRGFLRSTALAAGSLAFGGRRIEAADWDDRALRVHREATVVLGCVNVPQRFKNRRIDSAWFAEDDPRVAATLPKLRRGMVDVVALSFGVPRYFVGDAGTALFQTAPHPLAAPLLREKSAQVEYMLKAIESIRETLDAHADEIELASTAADIERINAAGKIAALPHMVGAWVGGDLQVLRAFHRLGVRIAHPCVEGLPGVGDTADDFPEFGGLSGFGKELIPEMNRLGMVVDVSHAADTSFWQIMELARAPVIASHSNCRALCPLNRCLDDDQIRAVAKNGGVVGVQFASGQIREKVLRDRIASGYYAKLPERHAEAMQRDPDPYDQLARQSSSRASAAPKRTPTPAEAAAKSSADLATLDELLAHVDHLVGVGGIDHVGVGSDYSVSDAVPDLNDASRLPNLTAALLARGYAENDTKKILGGNFLRVFRDVLTG